MGTKSTFKGVAFQLYDSVDKVNIPHLHGLDI
jgi:hypothetical protein